MMKFIHKHRFVLLFLSLIALIVLSSFITDNEISILLLGLVLLSILILLVLTLVGKKIVFEIAIILALTSLISYAIFLTQANEIAYMVHASVDLILFLLCIVVIFSKVLTNKLVTHETIFASLVVYILIGLSYSYIYAMTEWFLPGSFEFNEIIGQAVRQHYQLLYYSIITLTTVGYGDIVPVGHLARSFVMLESMTGVLYLAVLVARLVAVFKE